jgi:hypothetical protein
MFKVLLTALAIASTTTLFAQSKAATEAWVKNYVANQAASVAATKQETYENGVRTISITENGTNFVTRIEEPSVYALILTECSSVLSEKGITNNTIFAYTDGGVYKNKSGTIKATQTNLVLNATYQSKEKNGRCYFYDGENPIAKVYWTIIQPSVAQKIIAQ